MICQNCKKQINEESKTCPECGVIIAVEKPTNNVIIEQPVVNQVIEEEHKDKITKKDKKKILITISAIFFALSITTIIMANFLPEKEADKLTVPIPTIKPQEKEDLKTIEYNGYSISYLPDYTATIENDLLILEGTDLYFSIKLYPGVTKENYNQNKDKLKLDLTNSGFKINDEEKTIRSGIEFDLLKLSTTVDDIEEEYEYFLAVENDILYEIFVYELKDSNYAKVSNQLRTIIKNTKLIN